jgi:hypothetical protein
LLGRPIPDVEIHIPNAPTFMQFECEVEAQPFNIEGVGMQKTGHGNVLKWA